MTSNLEEAVTEITIEVPDKDDWDGVYKTFSSAINIDGDDLSAAAERPLFEPERSLVARRAGKIVGTLGATTRRIAVPGGVVSAAHGCRGGVGLTARRQGVLTRMMQRHFQDARDLGEPITLCWASEGRIYHRFGYGLAIRRIGLNIETREVGLPAEPVEGKIIEGTPDDFRDAIVGIYDRLYPERPGWSERTTPHWDFRLADLPWWRGGATALRAIVHEGEDGIDGYALWRASGTWTESGPNGEVQILEQVATTPAAYAALWRFLLTVDLTRKASIWSVSFDEPLFYWVGEPRRMSPNISDGLWVRVVDVPRALASRRYAVPVDLIIEVTDEFMPVNNGRYRLTGSTDSAVCNPASGAPDLFCDVRALGALYLGGAPVPALAGAGLIRELRPGALAEASAAFGWYRAPSAFEIY